MYEKNRRVHLERLNKNTQIEMELNMTPVLDKIQDRLPRVIKIYKSKRQKEAGETIEETSGRVT
jgi:hypothetical protein